MDHILVVDDEEAVKNALKDALEHFGYKVTVACNGKEGFENFNHYRNLKLVITDIKMPIMDGIEFAKLIKESDRPNIPVIAITAHLKDEHKKRGLFNSILGKPFNFGTLIKYVKQTLES